MKLDVILGVMYFTFITSNHAIEIILQKFVAWEFNLPTSNKSSNERANSFLECAVICLSDSSCQYYGYEKQTKECYTIQGSLSWTENKCKKATMMMKAEKIVTCKKNWMPFNLHCYSIVNKGLKFNDAVKDCKQRDANLVKIDDVCENQWIQTRQSERNIRILYIGLTNVEPWSWVSDMSPVDFNMWLTGEPEPHKWYENCATTTNGRWASRMCSLSYPYMCKM